MTEISPHEYEWMMEMAAREGLCCNCFHTLACCDGRCASESSMLHVCPRNPDGRPAPSEPAHA